MGVRVSERWGGVGRRPKKSWASLPSGPRGRRARAVATLEQFLNGRVRGALYGRKAEWGSDLSDDVVLGRGTNLGVLGVGAP